jgi:acyl carrier protein
MQRQRILIQIQDIFHEVLNDPEIRITEDTAIGDVEGWDSEIHYLLIPVIESHFRIKFLPEEIILSKNIGEMIDIVYEKLM